MPIFKVGVWGFFLQPFYFFGSYHKMKYINQNFYCYEKDFNCPTRSN